MAVYEITALNGSRYRITSPTDLDRETILTELAKLHPEAIEPPRAAEVPQKPKNIPMPKAANAAEEATGSWYQAVDPVLSLGQGVTGLGKSVTDVFGADNTVSSALSSFNDWMQSNKSAGARQEAAQNSAMWEAAKGKGLKVQAATAAQIIANSPVDMVAQGLGSVVPLILGSIATGGGLPATLLAGGIGVASGVGTVKSSIHDQVKQEFIAAGVPEAKASAIADEAQSYGGDNLDQIALGGALGLIASRFGVENVVGKAVAAKIAQSAVRKAGSAALGEGVTEGAQGAQEQLAANLALQRKGVQGVDTMRGVGLGAVSEGILGAIVGGGVDVGVHTVEQRAAAKEAPPELRSEVEQIAKTVYDDPDDEDVYNEAVARFAALRVRPEEADRYARAVADAARKTRDGGDEDVADAGGTERGVPSAGRPAGTGGVAPEVGGPVVGGVGRAGVVAGAPNDNEGAAKPPLDFHQIAEDMARGRGKGNTPDDDAFRRMLSDNHDEINKYFDDVHEERVDPPPVAQAAAPLPVENISPPVSENALPSASESVSAPPQVEPTVSTPVEAPPELPPIVQGNRGGENRRAANAHVEAALEPFKAIQFNVPKKVRADAAKLLIDNPEMEPGEAIVQAMPAKTQAKFEAVLKSNTEPSEAAGVAPDVAPLDIAAPSAPAPVVEPDLAASQIETPVSEPAPEEIASAAALEPQPPPEAIQPDAAPAAAPTDAALQGGLASVAEQATPPAAPAITPQVAPEATLPAVEQEAAPAKPVRKPRAKKSKTEFSPEPVAEEVEDEEDIDPALIAAEDAYEASVTQLPARQAQNANSSTANPEAAKPPSRMAAQKGAPEQGAGVFNRGMLGQQRVTEDVRQRLGKTLTSAEASEVIDMLRTPGTALKKATVGSDKHLALVKTVEAHTDVEKKRAAVEDAIPDRQAKAEYIKARRDLEKAKTEVSSTADEIKDKEDARRNLPPKRVKGRQDATVAIDKLKAKLKEDRAAVKNAEKALKAATPTDVDTLHAAEKDLANSVKALDKAQDEMSALAEKMIRDFERKRELKRIKINADYKLGKLDKTARDNLLRHEKVQAAADDEGSSYEVSQEEFERIDKELSGLNFGQAVNWAVENAPTGFDRAVAQAVQRAMGRLGAIGVGFNFKVVHNGDMAPMGIVNGFRGLAQSSNNHKEVRVWLRGADIGKSGTSYHALLHEIVHAVTMGAMQNASFYSRSDAKAHETMKELIAVKDAIVKHFNARVKARATSPLTDFEVSIYRGTNALADPYEIVAWALSNREMQAYLNDIPFDSKHTLWSKLVDAVRRFLGLDAKDGSALAAVLRASESLMDTSVESYRYLFDPDDALELTDIAAGIQDNTNAANDNAEEPDTTPADKTVIKGKQLKQIDAEEFLRASPDRVSDEQRFVDGVQEGVRARSEKGWLGGLISNTKSIAPNKLKHIVKGVSSEGLLQWMGDEYPFINEIANLSEEFLAEQKNLTDGFAKFMQGIQKWVDKNGQGPLADAAHMSQILRVDTDVLDKAASVEDALKADPVRQYYLKLGNQSGISNARKAKFLKQAVLRKSDVEQMWKLWQNLKAQDGGVEIYHRIRQFHADMYAARRAELERYLDEMGISPEAKAATLLAVQLEHEKPRSMEMPDSKNADDRYPEAPLWMFPRDYFPLKRYGEFYFKAAEVKPSAAHPKGFEAITAFFETAKERDDFWQDIAKERGVDPEDSTVFSVGDNVEDLNKSFMNDSSVMQQVVSAINKVSGEKVDRADLEALQNELYNIHVFASPQGVLRKQFLHRKGRAGFSSDIMRNTGVQATAYANELPKLKYRRKIELAGTSAYDALEAQEGGDPLKVSEIRRAKVFIKELNDRARAVMNPDKQNPWVTKLNRVAFVTMLTGAATAATQFTGIPIRVMPRLGREHGMGAATAKIMAFMPVWQSLGIKQVNPDGTTTWTAPSVGNSARLRKNPASKRAFEVARDQYAAFTTSANSILQNATTPTSTTTTKKLGKWTGRFIEGMSYLFNAAERISREITYMAAFELQYAKTKDFDASVQYAIKTTNETLGSYSEFNRPTIMRGDIGRMMFMFKMYSVNTTQFFIHNTAQMWTGKGAEGIPSKVRIGAMKELSGVLLAGAAFHGIGGMPLYSTIAMLVDYFLMAFGDDDDEKKRRQRNPFTQSDSDYRFRNDWLPDHFGEITIGQHSLADILMSGPVSVLGGANVGSRTSFDGLWFRGSQGGAENWDGALMETIANNVPGISAARNMARGAQAIYKGDVLRGMEQISPAAFRGVITATRYGREGSKTWSGDTMVSPEEISPSELAVASTGFQPTQIARLSKQRAVIKKSLDAKDKEKSDLYLEFNEAMEDPRATREARIGVLKKMLEYNEKYPDPEFAITPESIMKSYNTRSSRKEFNVVGVPLDAKTLHYFWEDIQDSTRKGR